MSAKCDGGNANVNSRAQVGLTIIERRGPMPIAGAAVKVSLGTSPTSILCPQCRVTPFRQMLEEVANEQQGGPTTMILDQRVGLDAHCILCRLLAERILPGDYDYEITPGSDRRWQLRAFSIRNMLLHSRALALFKPIPAAIFHASDRDRAYISHAQDEAMEMRGYLAFTSTKQLAEYLNQSDEETDWDDDHGEVVASDGAGAGSGSHEDELGPEADSSDDGDSDQTVGSEDDSEDFESQPESEEDRTPTKSNLIGATYDVDLLRSWISDSKNETSLFKSAAADDDGQFRSMDGIPSNASLANSPGAQVPGTGSVIKGMLVIDCSNGQIVSRTNDMHYLALSYVWRLANNDLIESGYSQSCQHSENHEERKLPDTIPRAVHNAIQVTLDLGYRYLWVDQFCIDQTATIEEKADHISKMDLVYSLAEVTIITASSGGALPGVGSTPRTEQLVLDLEIDGATEGVTIFTIPPPLERDIRAQVWFTRGWCFQESLLSQRRLYFTDHQMMFEAAGIHLCDAFPERHESTDRMLFFDFHDNPSLAWPASWDERLQESTQKCEYGLDDARGRFWTESWILFDLLKTYTAKELSYDSDAMYAFSGVFKVFSRNDRYFKSVQGLPTMDVSELVIDQPKDVQRTYTEFARKHFSLALEWEHVGSAQRRPGFPSWSWAGWRGQVHWDRVLSHTSRFTDAIDFYHAETFGGGITSIAEKERSKEVYYLIGEAVLVPRSAFFFYHEWASLAIADRNKSPVLYHAQPLHSSLLLDGNDEAEKDMARKLETGKWECVLLNYRESETTGQLLGCTLLVVEWAPGLGRNQGDSTASARQCARVGLVKLSHRGSDFGVHEAIFWKELPKVHIRLG